MSNPVLENTILFPSEEDVVDPTAALDGEEEVEETPEVAELKTTLAAKDKKIQELLDENAQRRIREKEALKSTVDPNDAVAGAVAERDTYWKTKIAVQAASLALAKEGVEVTPRVLRMIETDDIDVDDDGTVSGLEEQIDQLKTDIPSLFVVVEKKVTKVAPKANASVASKTNARSAKDDLADAMNRGLFN